MSALPFSSFGCLSSWPVGLWSLGCRSMRLPKESSRCPWQTFVSPKSYFPAESVTGFCPGRLAVFYMGSMHFHLSCSGRFSFPCWQTSCCHEQNLLLMGIGIPLPFMYFSCDILEVLLRKSLTIWASSSPNTCITDTQQQAYLCSCPLQTLFLSLSAASAEATGLWILTSPFSSI